jgi:hypothetical protein
MLTALLLTLLAADGGTPFDVMIRDLGARATAARSRCEALVTSATSVETTDGVTSLTRAQAVIAVASPLSDEVELALTVDPAALGSARANALKSLGAALGECMRAADFLTARVLHTSAMKAPTSLTARDNAANACREYLSRYPDHPSTTTVKGWLQQLPR